MTTKNIDQDEILDLIAIAHDYGHANQICMGALVSWAWPITDEDIERYAAEFLTPEMRAQGYGEAEYEESKQRLTEFREQYRPDKEEAGEE